MKRYDIKCPICGTVNRNLDLEETDGWMECEKCGTATQTFGIRPAVKIPVVCSGNDYLKSKAAEGRPEAV